MVSWQRTITRQSPKTKVELREMLAEAVRNTQGSPNQTLKGMAKAQRMETAAVRVD